ncbi:helix-turn-helix domain-containing protein [Hungatella hathewayi]|mgnify:CR=1 FL=1|uniref:helix-turn-helix domain-containing protein n=1 Tax=Hungatella hathewayi TaxID=154046 RepID=UPI000E512A19|nr:helix-turn-helix transcriptional regulator [Hungatella hathewayi]RHB60403.1 XRE family transcriptional regulator [Hungatella hathewayi]
MEEIKIRSDNHVHIGANLKRIRKEKGIQACNLIRHLQLQGLNINKQRYYKLEHDLANVYASELVAMAAYLEVDISDFFKDH